MTPEFLTQQLAAWQPEMLALLEQLVNIDSGTGQKEGIEQILDIVEPKLQELGLTCQRHPSPVGPHLAAWGPREPHYMLMGHIDTVFPPGTAAQRPFRMEGGRAYGPGVTDMKAGIVSMIYILKALSLQSSAHLHARVVINADEEIGSPHSAHLIRQQARLCKAAFVFEPTRGLDLVTTGRKGVADINIRVKGKASHAGSAPEDGLSAIDEIARKITRLHGLNANDRGITVNVGTVRGGTARNVVAETAEAEVDVRFVTKEDGEQILEQVREACFPSRSGYEISISGGISRPPLERTPEVVALFQHVEQAGRAFGIELKEAYSGGVSDGNFIADEGVPVVDAMGPVGGRIHSDEEFLEVDSIVPRAAMAAWAIHQWLAREGA